MYNPVNKSLSRLRFTPEQVEAIRRDYPGSDSRALAERIGCSLAALYRKANALRLEKSQAFKIEQGKRIASKNHNFLKNSFKKGNIPFSKGKKAAEIYSREAIEKMRETQFQKGHKPYQTKYDGAITVRTGKWGKKYKVIRLSAGKWEVLSRYLWKQHHGAIPEGYNIVFRDGNPLNCVIENLECIPGKELAERNRITKYPAELQAAIKTKNKINKKIKEYGKKQN
ncbi:MAG: HNH endonuclease [Tannerella sp.]|jgi:hypothetical protein|nr:HNH endonuclease [Tannerella sp.]